MHCIHVVAGGDGIALIHHLDAATLAAGEGGGGGVLGIGRRRAGALADGRDVGALERADDLLDVDVLWHGSTPVIANRASARVSRRRSLASQRWHGATEHDGTRLSPRPSVERRAARGRLVAVA